MRSTQELGLEAYHPALGSFTDFDRPWTEEKIQVEALRSPSGDRLPSPASWLLAVNKTEWLSPAGLRSQESLRSSHIGPELRLVG